MLILAPGMDKAVSELDEVDRRMDNAKTLARIYAVKAAMLYSVRESEDFYEIRERGVYNRLNRFEENGTAGPDHQKGVGRRRDVPPGMAGECRRDLSKKGRLGNKSPRDRIHKKAGKMYGASRAGKMPRKMKCRFRTPVMCHDSAGTPKECEAWKRDTLSWISRLRDTGYALVRTDECTVHHHTRNAKR
ncbi:MAG: hypothetical protein MPJ08_02245 [Nitrosopumilus sp.]|nr:hypothetical protein [Nitrosopumilus sp.]